MTLQEVLAHFVFIGEAHVIADQRQNLFGVAIGKTQPFQNVARQRLAQFHVTVKANTIGDAEGTGLADIVQQNAHG